MGHHQTAAQIVQSFFSPKLRRSSLPWLALLVTLYLLLLWRGQSSRKTNLRNPHDYKYLTNPGASVCGQDPVSILVLVTSGLQHGERRRAIRETWASQTIQRRRQLRLVFLLGTTTTLQPSLEQELAAEAEQYGDIVREDFLDTYQNLTLKTIAGVKWAGQHCHQASFVLKTDDDMYVNTGALAEFLARQFSDQERIITGCVKNDPAGPLQPLPAAGQPGLPFRSVHPLFMAGAGYVLSGDLLNPLYAASLDIRLVKVEDAFLTGYCARRVGGVRKVHQERFSCGEMVVRDCDMEDRFTGHKISPERMRDIHHKLSSGQCR